MDTDKLKDIQKRIKELKPTENLDSKPATEISPFTVATDLVSGTMVGVVCGLLTDKFFNTKPLFLIIFTIIGIIAGFSIIIQRLNNKK